MEIVIKASMRAMRIWLARMADDENETEHNRWLASQTLDKLNELSHE